MKIFSLLAAILVMCLNNIAEARVAEAEDQELDQGQGVMWVEGGVDSEVPENAIRGKIGKGLPLCRGTKGDGTRNAYKDIGTVGRNGNCLTQRKNKEQESFYYLVPTHAGGEPPMDGSILPGRIAELEAELLATQERLDNILEILQEVASGME